MEVHAQLLTNTKMFCRCSADYQGAPPNTHTCPVCLGLPGALPVSNRAAVEATIRTGLALNCEIAETAVFARKNYHYPDLPKGYQISQYELPLCRNGWVEIELARRRRQTHPHPPRPPGRGHRQEHACGAAYAGRPEPGRDAADGDRHRGRHCQRRRGLRLPDQAALDPALPGRQQRQHGGGRPALRAQYQRAHAGAGRPRRVRHQGRGQEPQQPARGAQRHRLRGRTPGRRAEPTAA